MQPVRGHNAYTPDQEDAWSFIGLPFDVRALGLCYWRGFETYDKFEDLVDRATKMTPREVRREPDGKWRITLERRKPVLMQDVLWIDESRGFTIARSETRVGNSVDNSILWDDAYVSEVSWTDRKGIWVPKTLKLQETGDIVARSYALSFEWESVNDPVSDELFTKEGLAGKDRNMIIDMTTGKRVVTSVLNDKPQYRTFYDPKLHVMPENTSSRWILTIGSVVVSVALTVAVILIARRRRAAI
jgi:hypothetical protein